VVVASTVALLRVQCAHLWRVEKHHSSDLVLSATVLLWFDHVARTARIFPQICRLCHATISSVATELQCISTDQDFEMFGYDFMVDQELIVRTQLLV